MPILRSRRSYSCQLENRITNKDKSIIRRHPTRESTEKRRTEGATEKTKKVLRQINVDTGERVSAESKVIKNYKSKMVNDEESKQTPAGTKENLLEIAGNTTKTPMDEVDDEQMESDMPLNVVPNIDGNEACSSSIKENIEESIQFEKEDSQRKRKGEVNENEMEKMPKIKNHTVHELGKEKPSCSNATKTKSISLKSQNSAPKYSEDENSAANKLPKQLLTVISNLYLNVGERMHLDFPPRCLDDLAFCHRNHYRSELPEAPMTSQAHSLRGALQHYRYVSFINGTTDMCHRGEFPGKGIFTKIIELVLSINYITKRPNVNISTYQQSYHKSIALFSMVVRTFPPCWHKMRSYYVGFLEYGLDVSKLVNDKEEFIPKSAKIFDIILDLLENLLKSSKAENIIMSKSETLQPQNMALDSTSPLLNSDASICSEYWNQNEYEQKEREKQTFAALPIDQKWERVFMCLKLLLQILENDLAMWILHHNKKTKEWIFCTESRPLIVVLCEFTQFTRMTRVARRIFSIYSEATAKGLCKNRLKVLERFISLLMIASNTADMENTAIGVKYPFLGEQTKTLIHEFFKIFKAHNREEISKYMDTVELLRIPYVRYEFIDNVLIMFQFTNSEPLTPQKIALDIAKKRWLKYKPAAELINHDEDISREQYLHLLLDALRKYCEFHGSKSFFHVITNMREITYLSTTGDTVHRWPTHGSGVLVLSKMAKDIVKLESKLKMTVRMSKPKVDLPLADICIDENIILKYRNDLKFIVSLQNVLLKQKETYPEVDFSKWLEFLSDFSPKRTVKEV